MLEFWIDPESPYHKPIFNEDKRFVFFCGAGWRSALSAATAQEMGLRPVAHVEGGFTAWKEAPARWRQSHLNGSEDLRTRLTPSRRESRSNARSR